MLGDSPWLSLLWMLVCVVLITGLAYWFTRNVLGRKLAPGLSRKGEALSVISYVNLGREQRAAVVRAGSRYFLVGVTQQSVNLLSELDGEEISRWEKEEPEKEHPGFQEALKENILQRLHREIKKEEPERAQEREKRQK